MCLIDATENCNVATVDLPGALKQAETEGNVVHMKMEGRTDEILTKLYHKLYQKYTQ